MEERIIKTVWRGHGSHSSQNTQKKKKMKERTFADEYNHVCECVLPCLCVCVCARPETVRPLFASNIPKANSRISSPNAIDVSNGKSYLISNENESNESVKFVEIPRANPPRRTARYKGMKAFRLDPFRLDYPRETVSFRLLWQRETDSGLSVISTVMSAIKGRLWYRVIRTEMQLVYLG